MVPPSISFTAYSVAEARRGGAVDCNIWPHAVASHWEQVKKYARWANQVYLVTNPRIV